MRFEENDIYEVQAATSFDLLCIEKVLRLMSILEIIFHNDELAGKYVLKGGTALNLFYFRMPRLSVDIDLNYLGLERETMLADRVRHEKILSDLLKDNGYVIKRVPSDHAGGKWRLGYTSFTGLQQNIELDINYMHRMALMPVQIKNSFSLGMQSVSGVSVLDIHELAAGKLCALLSRCKPRDLFDAAKLLIEVPFNREQLRLCFIIYAAFNTLDFSTIHGLGEIKFTAGQFRQELIATLATNVRRDNPQEYLEQLVAKCHDGLSLIMPFSSNEQKFLAYVNKYGQIRPALLTDNADWHRMILNHPMLLWKVFNVRKHYGME
ncbi:MAG: nucleotidyl transferase AbiEii/AbiGii toxin family protein [Oligosphaeraceae bacterium]|nr:nucleotidyl transferase AbiEii/AbiGii toxin family protein [Oligosphaeraceae bacterium]